MYNSERDYKFCLININKAHIIVICGVPQYIIAVYYDNNNTLFS